MGGERPQAILSLPEIALELNANGGVAPRNERRSTTRRARSGQRRLFVLYQGVPHPAPSQPGVPAYALLEIAVGPPKARQPAFGDTDGIGMKPGNASMRASHARTAGYGSSEMSPSGARATYA